MGGAGHLALQMFFRNLSLKNVARVRIAEPLRFGPAGWRRKIWEMMGFNGLSGVKKWSPYTVESVGDIIQQRISAIISRGELKSFNVYGPTVRSQPRLGGVG